MTDAGNAMMAALPMGDHLNYTAVLACGALNFFVSFLWYSPMGFMKSWMKAAKLTPKSINRSNMGLMYAGWVTMSFLVALSMGYLLMLTHATDATSGLRAAWTAWIGFTVAAAMGDYMALRRGMPLFMINMGAHLVNFSLNALVLTAWR
jgi:hypothetical protein